MARDRAKEKLQANKKAKLDRKEAKLDKKDKECDPKKKTLEANPNKKNNRKETEKDLERKARGDDVDYATSKGFKSYKLRFTQSPQASLTVEGGDFSSIGLADVSINGSIASQPGLFKVPHVGNVKGKKEATKTFAAGPNPNRGKIKPIWRLALEDAAAQDRRQEAKRSKPTRESKSREEFQDYRIQDLLKPDECRQLKEILEASSIDEISHEVAAIALNRYDLVKKLMKDGYFIAKKVEAQRITPMSCAIQFRNWEMIQFLIDKNICVHCKDAFGNTPLIKAVLSPSWTSQLMLDLWMMLKFDSSTDLISSNKAGVTFFHGIAYRGWTEILEDVMEFISERKTLRNMVSSLVNSAMWNGCTPLMLAIDGRNTTTCEFLLSKGASPLTEDKTGFTPVCRAMRLAFIHPIPSFLQQVHPICPMLIVSALTHIENWNLRTYTLKRLNFISNPAWESGFNETFYRLASSLFSFIVRWMQGGTEILLQLKFFSRLVTIGLKHINYNDFIQALFGVVFEVLIYAEDFYSVWSQYVTAFLSEGAADFCLRLLQRPECELGDYMGGASSEGSKDKYQSSTASVSEPSKVIDLKDIHESLAFLEKPPPSEKNLGLAAFLPLIQVIDAPEMTSWFSSHFKTLSRCYQDLISKRCPGFVISVSLTPEHAERTTAKASLFGYLMNREDWVLPSDANVHKVASSPITTDCFNKSKNARKKRNRKQRQKSVNDYLSRLHPSAKIAKLPSVSSKDIYNISEAKKLSASVRFLKNEKVIPEEELEEEQQPIIKEYVYENIDEEEENNSNSLSSITSGEANEESEEWMSDAAAMLDQFTDLNAILDDICKDVDNTCSRATPSIQNPEFDISASIESKREASDNIEKFLTIWLIQEQDILFTNGVQHLDDPFISMVLHIGFLWNCGIFSNLFLLDNIFVDVISNLGVFNDKDWLYNYEREAAFKSVLHGEFIFDLYPLTNVLLPPSYKLQEKLGSVWMWDNYKLEVNIAGLLGVDPCDLKHKELIELNELLSCPKVPTSVSLNTKKNTKSFLKNAPKKISNVETSSSYSDDTASNCDTEEESLASLYIEDINDEDFELSTCDETNVLVPWNFMLFFDFATSSILPSFMSIKLACLNWSKVITKFHDFFTLPEINNLLEKDMWDDCIQWSHLIRCENLLHDINLQHQVSLLIPESSSKPDRIGNWTSILRYTSRETTKKYLYKKFDVNNPTEILENVSNHNFSSKSSFNGYIRFDKCNFLNKIFLHILNDEDIQNLSCNLNNISILSINTIGKISFNVAEVTESDSQTIWTSFGASGLQNNDSVFDLLDIYLPQFEQVSLSQSKKFRPVPRNRKKSMYQSAISNQSKHRRKRKLNELEYLATKVSYAEMDFLDEDVDELDSAYQDIPAENHSTTGTIIQQVTGRFVNKFMKLPQMLLRVASLQKSGDSPETEDKEKQSINDVFLLGKLTKELNQADEAKSDYDSEPCIKS